VSGLDVVSKRRALQAYQLRHALPSDRLPNRGGGVMPEKQTLDRARRDRRQGKAPSTQAGEFIREEIDHIREGRHGARSTKQAIAIGLSKARRAGVELKPPKAGSPKTRRSAERDYAAGHGAPRKRKSTKARSRASLTALRRESTKPAGHAALAAQAKSAARRRSPAQRSAAAERAVATKGPAERSAAARKAASTRRASS
jgi:hypothetical protein